MKMAGAVRTGGKGSMRRCKTLFQCPTCPLNNSFFYWVWVVWGGGGGSGGLVYWIGFDIGVDVV